MDIFTPEIIEQLKGVGKTIIALGGWDMVTGALPNHKIKRLSVIFNLVEKSLRSFASLFIGIANMVKGIQGYGKDKV